ncbi:MAG: SGNH/GDSL hydrolase family protein [Thermoguttaceae bacterium]
MFSNNPKSKFRRLAIRLFTALLAFCLAIGVCEIVLRLCGYYYTPLHIKLDGEQHDWRTYHAFGDEHFIYDRDLFWRPKPGLAPFNSQGYRGRVLVKEKGPEEFRIFTIGDSNTLGWAGKEDDANWPRSLELLFADSEKDVVVVNAGVWGYSSFQGVRRLKEILPFEPDMVLISFGSNDAFMVDSSDAEFADRVVTFPLFNTRCGQLLLAARERLFSLRDPPGKEDLVFRVNLEEYVENISEMARIAKENGITCIFLTRPFIGSSHTELWWKDFAPDYVTATLDTAKKLDLPAIDVYEEFKDKEDLFDNESHFTKEGHQKAAEFIYEKINPLVQ